MASLPMLVLSIADTVNHSLRAAAYRHMAQMVYGWAPDANLPELPKAHRAIELDFSPRTRKRLLFIRRQLNGS